MGEGQRASLQSICLLVSSTQLLRDLHQASSVSISLPPPSYPTICWQVYPRFLRLAAEAADPVERLKWVVTYFIAGA